MEPERKEALSEEMKNKMDLAIKEIITSANEGVWITHPIKLKTYLDAFKNLKEEGENNGFDVNNRLYNELSFHAVSTIRITGNNIKFDDVNMLRDVIMSTSYFEISPMIDGTLEIDVGMFGVKENVF